MARRVLMAEVSGGLRGKQRLGWIDGVTVASISRVKTEEAMGRSEVLVHMWTI